MEPSDDQKLADEWAAALGEDPDAPEVDVDEVMAAQLDELQDTGSVSYTHLTLPTTVDV